jgi:hypothetical protein
MFGKLDAPGRQKSRLRSSCRRLDPCHALQQVEVVEVEVQRRDRRLSLSNSLFSFINSGAPLRHESGIQQGF